MIIGYIDVMFYVDVGVIGFLNLVLFSYCVMVVCLYLMEGGMCEGSVL